MSSSIVAVGEYDSSNSALVLSNRSDNRISAPVSKRAGSMFFNTMEAVQQELEQATMTLNDIEMLKKNVAALNRQVETLEHQLAACRTYIPADVFEEMMQTTKAERDKLHVQSRRDKLLGRMDRYKTERATIDHMESRLQRDLDMMS